MSLASDNPPETAALRASRAPADEALRRSEEYFRLALSAANLGDWNWDAATDMVNFSARAAEIFGIASGPYLTWTEMRELLHEQDRERARVAVERALETRSDYDIEYRVCRPQSGEWVWVAAKGRGTYAASGVTGMIGVVQDITARKRDEERLRAHERELQLISAHAPAVLSHWDRDYRLIFASRAFADRWDTTPDALLGKTAAEVLGQEAFERFKPHIDRALAGESVRFDMDVAYEGIGMRHVSASYAPEIGDDGDVRGFLVAVIDLTDRRRTEMALQQSEERLRLATRTGKIGLWDWDIAANRVAWTESLYEIHGVTAAEFDGTLESFANLIHPEDRGPVRRAIQSALDHDAHYEMEFRAVRPSGGVIWVFTNASVMREDGRAVRMVGATFDVTARKIAELALRESEARFRALASHAPVGIFLTDANGDCVFANETLRTMSGLPIEQLRGTGWRQALHPDDRARIVADWTARVQARRAFATEFRFLRPDSTTVWLQSSAAELRGPQGGVMGYIGTVADITQRKAAEDALRASEKRFRTLASHAPVGIFLTNPEGDTLFVNEAWSAMVGMSLAEAQGQGWTNAIHPDDRARVLGEWADAVRRDAAAAAEYRFWRADGTITWVQGNAVPLRGADGRVAGYIGTIADVTQRKVAEEKLRAQEAQLRLLADNIAGFAWVIDAAGQHEWMNQRFFDYTGFTLAEVREGRGRTLVHPDDDARVREKFQRHLVSGEPWEDLFRFKGRDGKYRWFLSRAIPIRDTGDRVVRWFGTNTDVTELRETQEKLRQAQAQLQSYADDLEQKVEARTASLREAIAQMEEFSYSVSHDLRAPLRAINAYAEALAEDYSQQLDDTAKNFLQRIRRSSQRMENLTHDVLTYSRVARAEVELRELNLETLLRDLIANYPELQPGAADVAIETPLLAVRAHESSLAQCLANLLTNAAKFVEPGVRPSIRVRTAPAGERVRVSVEDNGIGIAPADQARLFRVFERAPTRHVYEGTGIGLAIVRKAMEKMGGRCGIESNGRQGSCFWLELPRA